MGKITLKPIDAMNSIKELFNDLDKLKELEAIIHTGTMRLFVRYDKKLHLVDLREGDLEDNWNSIYLNDGRVFDINVAWEDGPFPSVALYPTHLDEDGKIRSTDWTSEIPVKVKRKYKIKSEYFLRDEIRFIDDDSIRIIGVTMSFYCAIDRHQYDLGALWLELDGRRYVEDVCKSYWDEERYELTMDLHLDMDTFPKDDHMNYDLRTSDLFNSELKATLFIGEEYDIEPESISMSLRHGNCTIIKTVEVE